MLATVIFVAILILSVIVHEVSHGYVADALGDPTARLAGRLTLNPLVHIDIYGSIIVPIITSLFGFTFGWAKPVPYNPYNLKNKRVGELLIAAAGPASNLLIALIFGTVVRYAVNTNISKEFLYVTSYIVLINIVLAIFNLVPLPPLDGSKILFSLLPQQYGKWRTVMEMYSPVFVLIAVFFLWQFLAPIIPVVFHVFTGQII